MQQADVCSAFKVLRGRLFSHGNAGRSMRMDPDIDALDLWLDVSRTKLLRMLLHVAQAIVRWCIQSGIR
jgi:hypothetical protein